MKPYCFFIAGIIQGSIAAESVHNQDYRERIKRAVREALPTAKVYCPFENHPESLGYDDAKARRVFFDHVVMAADADCLVTFLPEASMGTAVEMYAARIAEKAVITISPMAANWTVKFLSDIVLEDLETFEDFARSGRLGEFLDGFYRRRG